MVGHLPRPGFVAGAVLALGLLAVPALRNDYLVTVLVLAGIYAIAGVGLNLFMGYTGQVSFGHNAFAAVGGYTTAILTTAHGWSSTPALVLGVILAVVAAVVVGYPTLKLRGHYLAMATFALGLITYGLSVQLEGLTKGFVGIAGIPPLGVGPFALTRAHHYFYAVWLLVALGVWCTERLIHSRLGLAMRAVRGNEDAAQALGIDVTRCKVIALAVSGAYAAVAGSLFAHFVSYISPEVYGLYMVVLLFTMLFVGGLGTTYGPILGALLIGSLPELLRGFKDYQELVYAGLLLVILIVAPRGLFSLTEWWPRPATRP